MPIGLGTGLAVAGGASLVGAGINAYSANAASNKQAQAAQAALALQQQEFAQTQQNLAPYLGIGSNAVNSLSGLYGFGGSGGSGGTGTPDFSQFQNSPDFLFAQQQGNLGVSRYLNATGQAQSGGALKDIASFNQGLASQQYGNYFSRLLGLATLGNNAATTSASSATAGANAMGNTIQGIGQAQASGIVGVGNAATGGLNSIGSNFMLSGLLSQYGQGSNSAYAGMKGIGGP